MELELARFGNTFATRQRAREVVESLGPAASTDEVLVDLSGVSASPSFMAELLGQLTVRFVTVSITGGSDYLRKLTWSLVEKLGLRGRVHELASLDTAHGP